MTLSNQQWFAKAAIEIRNIKRELGKHLAGNGGGRQHSVADYGHVLCTQLNLQEQGDNPRAEAVLRKAYPDDPAKAKSIGNSQRITRVKQAYELDQVKNHPVQLGIAGIYSARELQQRLAGSHFRQSLAVNCTMFGKGTRITLLESKVAQLEEQMRSTKCREALDDAGATTSGEKVLALHAMEWSSSEISVELGMTPGAVRVCLSRARKAGKIVE